MNFAAAGHAPAPSVRRVDTSTALSINLVAHRGDINPVDGYPENTLEGFTQAVARHPWIEVDVQRSSDGTWYCIHDTTVDRTTDGTGNVADKTDAQMDALAIDGGIGYRDQTGLSVPSLSSVLALSFTRIRLDLKETTDAAHTALANLVISEGLTEEAVVIVNSVSGAAAVKAVSSSISTACGSNLLVDVENQPNIDALSANVTLIDSAFVAARDPKPVSGYHSGGSGWDGDEKAMIATVFDAGAVGLTTNDLPDALLYANPSYVYTAVA